MHVPAGNSGLSLSLSTFCASSFAFPSFLYVSSSEPYQLSRLWFSYAGLHLYFVSESGVTWRTSLLHRPYFYLSVKRNSLRGETASTYLLQLQEAIKDHLERVDVSAKRNLTSISLPVFAACGYRETDRSIYEI